MKPKLQPASPKTASRGEKRKLHREILKQMVTLTTSGFGLVAALAITLFKNLWRHILNPILHPAAA